jgi:hypothetical protein
MTSLAKGLPVEVLDHGECNDSFKHRNFYRLPVARLLTLVKSSQNRADDGVRADLVGHQCRHAARFADHHALQHGKTRHGLDDVVVGRCGTHRTVGAKPISRHVYQPRVFSRERASTSHAARPPASGRAPDCACCGCKRGKTPPCLDDAAVQAGGSYRRWAARSSRQLRPDRRVAVPHKDPARRTCNRELALRLGALPSQSSRSLVRLSRHSARPPSAMDRYKAGRPA